jgi:hypothetical protein
MVANRQKPTKKDKKWRQKRVATHYAVCFFIRFKGDPPPLKNGNAPFSDLRAFTRKPLSFPTGGAIRGHCYSHLWLLAIEIFLSSL